jgi:hypothetical protein
LLHEKWGKRLDNPRQLRFGRFKTDIRKALFRNGNKGFS